MSKTKNVASDKCKPFLRWAGGKTWLIKHLDQILPANFNSYHEPFLGGGAMFFNLRPDSSYLSDLNEELIETYIEIRDNVEGVIEELRGYKNEKDFYYEMRDKKFRSPRKRAARFVFLNQTSFNGIYRVNLQGKYNVPYGYRTKDFFEPDNLRKVSSALNKSHIGSNNFTQTIDHVSPGDLVFLDPPYTVAHNDNGFIKYNARLFDLDQQYELADFIEEVRLRGAYYILTNAAHNTVREIFDNGDRVLELGRASLIGGKKAKRGTYSELIFTNTELNEGNND